MPVLLNVRKNFLGWKKIPRAIWGKLPAVAEVEAIRIPWWSSEPPLLDVRIG